MARGKEIGTFGFCNECGERRAGTRSRSGLRCGTCGEPMTPLDVGGDDDDDIPTDEDVAAASNDGDDDGLPDNTFDGIGGDVGSDDFD